MSASAILKLQKVGFTTEQVEALADFMDTQSASKADVEAATHKLDKSITSVRSDLDLSIAAVRSELENLVHKVDMSIAGVKGDLRLVARHSDFDELGLGYLVDFPGSASFSN